MALNYPDKLKSNNPQAYGIVDSVEVSGHRSVASMDELFAIRDCILSRSGDNTDNDALSQIWYVGGTVNENYQLIDWTNRRNENGWKKVVMGGGDTVSITNDEIDGIFA